LDKGVTTDSGPTRCDTGKPPHGWQVPPAPTHKDFPNDLITRATQSPLFPLSRLDRNKRRTYKNIVATREMQMLVFLKDLAAFVTLGAFTLGSLTWMDVLTRLV